jgi:hypothetical protein
VNREDVGPADEDLRRLARQSQLDAGERPANRAGAALRVVGVRDEHQRLGHSVALEDPLPRRRLDGGVERGGQGGRARDTEPEAGQRLDSRMLGQTVVEGRHAEEEGRLERFDVAHDRVGIEARIEHGGATRVERAVEAHAEAVHVEEGQRQQQPIRLAPAPGEPQCLGARETIRVREDGALGPTRRARRITDECWGAGLARVEARRRSIGQLDLGAQAVQRRIDLRESRPMSRGVDQGGPRTCVAHDVGQLARTVGRVGGDHDESEAMAGHVACDQLPGALGAEQDALSGLQPEPCQAPGAKRRLGLQLAPTEPAPLGCVDLGGVGSHPPGAGPGARQITRPPGGGIEDLTGGEVARSTVHERALLVSWSGPEIGSVMGAPQVRFRGHEKMAAAGNRNGLPGPLYGELGHFAFLSFRL